MLISFQFIYQAIVSFERLIDAPTLWRHRLYSNDNPTVTSTDVRFEDVN